MRNQEMNRVPGSEQTARITILWAMYSQWGQKLILGG